MEQQIKQEKKVKIKAFTLVETIVSMSLISIIFLMIMQAFNSILLASYLVDARTAVRNESEFVSEYLTLRIKNADPRSINLDQDAGNLDCETIYTPDGKEVLKAYIKWNNVGSSSDNVFLYDGFSTIDPNSDEKNYRFCLNNSNNTDSCENVLTYPDVKVRPDQFELTCEKITIESTREEFVLINLNYQMDSTQMLGDRPAVRSVPRHISISIR